MESRSSGKMPLVKYCHLLILDMTQAFTNRAGASTGLAEPLHRLPREARVYGKDRFKMGKKCSERCSVHSADVGGGCCGA